MANKRVRFSHHPVAVNRPGLGSYPGMVDSYSDWVKQLPLDGFLYDEELYYLPYRYVPYCLQASRTLRNANLVRFKQWGAPINTYTVPAYTTYETKFNMVPGSRVIGIRYMEFFNAAASSGETTPVNGRIQITDVSSGLPYFHDFVNGQNFSTANTGSGQRRRTPGSYIPLTEPRLVTGTGQVSVEIANNRDTNTPLFCQLVLTVAEPVVLVKTPNGSITTQLNPNPGLAGGVRKGGRPV